MIWGIGDLHFDYSKEKPMDVFGDNWEDHDIKIVEHWREVVGEDDIVLLPGDISWALKLNSAIPDLKIIDELPGTKYMIRGNHDYWWGSNNKLRELGMKSINFISNNSYTNDGIGFVGTRGWMPRDADIFSEEDEKIYRRELIRLENSIKSLKGDPKEIIALIHFPPFNSDGSPNEFVEIMAANGVGTCVYGHLHAEGHNFVREGNFSGVDFYCVSSDYVDFRVKKIGSE